MLKHELLLSLTFLFFLLLIKKTYDALGATLLASVALVDLVCIDRCLVVFFVSVRRIDHHGLLTPVKVVACCRLGLLTALANLNWYVITDALKIDRLFTNHFESLVSLYYNPHAPVNPLLANLDRYYFIGIWRDLLNPINLDAVLNLTSLVCQLFKLLELSSFDKFDVSFT